MGLLGLLIASIVGSVLTATTSAVGSAVNANAQKEANDANIEAQNKWNEQQQYNLEHAHQIEMADLKAAGLNPVLTATGGSGAAVGSFNAPKVNPVGFDTSGISGALSGLSSSMMSMMTMMYMMDMRQEMYQSTLDVSRANNLSRNEVLSALYKRKAQAQAMTNSSATLSRVNYDVLHLSKKEREWLEKLFKNR